MMKLQSSLIISTLLMIFEWHGGHCFNAVNKWRLHSKPLSNLPFRCHSPDSLPMIDKTKDDAIKCPSNSFINNTQPISFVANVIEIYGGYLSKMVSSLLPRNKLAMRWLTGLTLGGVGTLWICSGNGIFTLGFLIASLIAQLEYYTMVRATGVEPAMKIGIVSSLACYLAAAFHPLYHEIVMPLSSTLLMMWLLIFNKKSASINEISSSLLGTFYIGYLPSFWVRLRALDACVPNYFTDIFRDYSWMCVDAWSLGAIITWWTWTSIVFADVGAYFTGKRFGKHKLSSISQAAGSASPNKTVEGALGGFLSCTLFSMLGAYLMRWPYWASLGAGYGLIISVVALVGDLTASMMKRDAGMKDTGNILPGHGGLLDRIDSYMFTAPIAFFFCKRVLPFARALHANSIS